MYNRILVPLDGSKLAECVIPHVISLAKEFRSKEVVLLRVCQPASILADYPSDMPEPFEEHVKAINAYSTQQCSLYLDTVEKQLKDAGLKNVRTVGKLGDAAKEIADFATKAEADLIIMATHGRSGPGRWAYGSVAEKVLRTTCVPVLSIKAPGCSINL